MTAVALQSRANPIPPDLRNMLPTQSGCPWEMSGTLFDRIQNPRCHVQDQKSNLLYKKAEVFPTDPEWRFIWTYFYSNKPLRYGIRKIHCVFERQQQQAFELHLSAQEREAETFPATWGSEPRADQRKRVVDRWKESAQIFSPFSTKESDGRTRVWSKTKVLPLWRGTCQAVCDSVSGSGFTFFGKTAIGHTSGSQSTGEGFFGSGSYFTSSARYAGDIYSRGLLFLGWVSMREPFPVVGDPNQEDMAVLQGKGAYKTYNAHYIPVTSANPSDPFESKYYPTLPGVESQCDEYVVFQETQTLPRFWVELQLETPDALNPSNIPQFVQELIPHLMKLLENPNVDRDLKLRNLISKELAALLQLKGDDDLEERYKDLHKQLTQLIGSAGEVNKQARNILTGAVTSGSGVAEPALSGPSPSVHQQGGGSVNVSSSQGGSKAVQEAMEGAVSSQGAAALSPPLSSSVSIAFGAEKWKKYFGDVGVEPPLPSNILEILSGPCPYWSGKTVSQTHLLILIPQTVNGIPFTLNLLGQIIQKPQSGSNATKYDYYGEDAKKECGESPSPFSYWILVTKDVLPDSRNKLFEKQEAYLKGAYTVPKALEIAAAVLMHHVETGEGLLPDSPATYTRCQEKADNDKQRMVVGSFGDAGLVVFYFHDECGASTCALSGVWKL